VGTEDRYGDDEDDDVLDGEKEVIAVV